MKTRSNYQSILACALIRTLLLVAVPTLAPAATNVILYETSFEPPAFAAGLPIRGQDNWQMFHDGEAISVSTNNARTGAQCLSFDGALLEQNGPNHSTAYCFSRALEGVTNPAPIIEVRASVRLDGPQTGANGTPDQDILSANLMAAVSNTPTTATFVGGFFVSSAGRIWNYSPVPGESYRYSVSYTQGTYRTLALRVDFIARRITYLVDGVELGSTVIGANITADRLYSGYLTLNGAVDPINTPGLTYDRTNHTAYFDDYSLVSIPLSPVNAVIEFASTNLLTDEFLPTASVRVIRRGFTNAAVRVTVSTTNLTAQAGEDYDAISTFVTFAAGETNKTVEIPLRDDYWAEPDKSFLVRISGLPPGATSPKSIARVTIRDDERPGSIDWSWSSTLGLPPLGPNQYADPRIVTQQPDGKLIINVTVVKSDTFDSLYWRILRLNTDGSVDPTFPVIEDRSQSNGGQKVVPTADGKILVVGYTLPAGQYRLKYRLNPDGTQDATFTNTIVGNGFLDLVPLPDGKILVNGGYNSPLLNGRPIAKLSRLNNDGTLDSTFTAPASLSFHEPLWLTSSGKILGHTLVFEGGSNVDKLYRLNQNGSLDSGFTVGTVGGPPAEIHSLVEQADGKIVVAGIFRTFNGQVRNSIVRLNLNGAIDSTFQSGSGFLFSQDPTHPAPVNLSPLPGAQLLATGGFDTYNGQSVPNSVLLEAGGTRDVALSDEGTSFSYPWGELAYVSAFFVDGRFLTSPSFFARYDVASPFFLTGYGLGRVRTELPLRIVSTMGEANGTRRFIANSLTGRTYTLQFSENLTNWIDLATQPATTNRIEFTDEPGIQPQRFYRVKQN